MLNSLDGANDIKTVVLMITQKQSLFGILVDPVRRLQNWGKERQIGRVFHRSHIL